MPANSVSNPVVTKKKGNVPIPAIQPSTLVQHPLDAHLRQEFGIDLIAPHRDNRVRPATQDGRSLRRYKRRWVIERFSAWLHNSRRLVTRWERHVENFVGMLQLGCMRILLRCL
jgi:hypothetical protein